MASSACGDIAFDVARLGDRAQYLLSFLHTSACFLPASRDEAALVELQRARFVVLVPASDADAREGYPQQAKPRGGRGIKGAAIAHGLQTAQHAIPFSDPSALPAGERAKPRRADDEAAHFNA
jgi:hypothetical protein